MNYASGILLVAIASFLQVQLRGYWGTKPYLLIYPAVFFSALIGGVYSGMISTVLASVSVWVLFLKSAGFGWPSGPDTLSLFIFASTGLLFSLFSGIIRTSIKREREALILREHAIAEQKEAQAALVEAVRVRDEFLSIASHELKTPLTSLKLQLQMASRSLKGIEGAAPVEKLKKGLDLSSRQAERLQILIDSLLDVARIQAGKLSFQFETVNLASLVREVVERFSEALQAAGCTLTLDADERVIVEADKFRLEQVVVNLLSNALKYGPGKPISVKVRRAEGKVYFSVCDNGMGIEPELQSKVFERFERAGQSTNISGLGLGLYISKQIAEGHGGRILIDSKPWEGATFQVEIPAVQLSGV